MFERSGFGKILSNSQYFFQIAMDIPTGSNVRIANGKRCAQVETCHRIPPTRSRFELPKRVFCGWDGIQCFWQNMLITRARGSRSPAGEEILVLS